MIGQTTLRVNTLDNDLSSNKESSPGACSRRRPPRHFLGRSRDLIEEVEALFQIRHKIDSETRARFWQEQQRGVRYVLHFPHRRAMSAALKFPP